MLHNAYFLPKIGADTAENEQHFAGGAPGPRARAHRGRAAWGGARTSAAQVRAPPRRVLAPPALWI